MRWYYRSKIAAHLNSSKGELSLRSVYFPALKAVYLPNPKVAGSTIMTTLISADGSPHLAGIRDHNEPESRRLMSAEYNPRAFWRALLDPGHFRFAFVRDPYGRAVSAFLDKIVSGREVRFRTMLGFEHDEQVSFLTFLNRISEQEVSKMNRHWRPQSALISPDVKLNFVGRFELFSDDFHRVLEQLGVEETSVSAKRDHQTSATDNLNLIGADEKALIDRLYGDDFERFSYAKRLPIQ